MISIMVVSNVFFREFVSKKLSEFNLFICGVFNLRGFVIKGSILFYFMLL